MGFVLLLNAPPNMQFGIDNQFWTTGPLFKGVKLIPSGAHFIYYALKDEEYASRMGFFIYVPEPSKTQRLESVIVRQWDEHLQAFVKLDSSEESAYQEGVLNMDFDSNLGAYPVENYSQWI